MPESSSLLSLSHSLDVATLLVGAGLIWTGVRFYLDPPARMYTTPNPLRLSIPLPPFLGVVKLIPSIQLVARFFGLAAASADELIVFQSGTGRNIGAGLFVWIMTFLGERKVLGIFLLCWTWAGIADSKLLYEHPHGHNVGLHVRNIFILLILGPLLIASSRS